MADDLGKYLNKFTAASQDWSKIGKDISNDLRKEITTRQETKAEIDKQTREAIDKVNQVQLGQNKTFNQFLLNGSGQTKEFLLMQERLLKQGLLKPQDYLNSRQIISDDWKNLSEAAKGYNEDYEEAMTRIQEGKAAGQDMYQNKKYDAFMNVQDKNIFINPVDGRMYLTTVDEKGKIDKDPASMLNVNAINARRKDKIDKFNVTAEVQKSTKALGDVLKVINKDGVLTRQDVRGMEINIGGVPKEFGDAKNDIIESLMTSPRNNASILYDAIGGYTFTETESEKGGKMIYLKEDGLGLLQPELTEEQEQAVRDKLDMEIEKQLGFKETSTYATDVQAKLSRERIYKADADKRKEGGKSLNLLADLYYGDEDEIDVALKNLRGIKTNMGVITKIARDPYGVYITTEGYDPVPFEFGDKTPTEFVESISSEFGINFQDAVRGANIKNKPVNLDVETFVERKKSIGAEERAENAYQNTYRDTPRTLEGASDLGAMFGISVVPDTDSFLGGYYLIKAGKPLTGSLGNDMEDIIRAIDAQVSSKDKVSALKSGEIEETETDTEETETDTEVDYSNY